MPNKDDDERPESSGWPDLLLWVGRCSWREWIKITAFTCVVVMAAHLAGWF